VNVLLDVGGVYVAFRRVNPPPSPSK
jgi:hypothetical protein